MKLRCWKKSLQLKQKSHFHCCYMPQTWGTDTRVKCLNKHRWCIFARRMRDLTLHTDSYSVNVCVRKRGQEMAQMKHLSWYWRIRTWALSANCPEKARCFERLSSHNAICVCIWKCKLCCCCCRIFVDHILTKPGFAFLIFFWKFQCSFLFSRLLCRFMTDPIHFRTYTEGPGLSLCHA